jgi:hypothetical protein
MRFKHVLLAIASVAALSASTIGNTTELITNGNFETGTYGQIGYNATLAGWSTTGYNFLFNASNDDTGGVTGQYGNLQLWGPGNGSKNGLSASPAGGNYYAADGAYGVQPLTQTINGLVVGQKYDLSFYWAGAQQYNFNGATTEQWKVSFGNENYATAVKTNADHGFTGWQQEVVTFTATSSSQLLSFLAVGTPNGVPPFSLLDGVSMTAKVPEPGTLAIVGLGLGLLGFSARRRKSKKQ